MLTITAKLVAALEPEPRDLFVSDASLRGFVGDRRSRRGMREAAAAFRGASDLPLETCATSRRIPGVGRSDHGPFWRRGHRPSMATDTAFHRNPFYHTARDLPATLDYGRFGAAVDGLVGCFARLATEG